MPIGDQALRKARPAYGRACGRFGRPGRGEDVLRASSAALAANADTHVGPRAGRMSALQGHQGPSAAAVPVATTPPWGSRATARCLPEDNPLTSGTGRGCWRVPGCPLVAPAVKVYGAPQVVVDSAGHLLAETSDELAGGRKTKAEAGSQLGSHILGDPVNGWVVSLAGELQRSAGSSAYLTRTQLSRGPAEAPSAAAPRHSEGKSPGHWLGLVGEARLELATSCSQSRCATNCATPRGRCSSVLTWVLAPRVLTGLLTVTP